MNATPPDVRIRAVELFRQGWSARAISRELEIHRNTANSIVAELRLSGGRKIRGGKQKISTGKGADEFAEVPMTKSRRQYLRLKATGHFKKNKCKDCGGPCGNQRCKECWLRTAALKRIAKQFHEDSPEYIEAVTKLFAL